MYTGKSVLLKKYVFYFLVPFKIAKWFKSNRRRDSPPDITTSSEVEKVLHAIPPRSITGEDTPHVIPSKV
jgi:hypothetical protein